MGVGVGERQLEDSFVCFSAKATQRVCTRDFLRDQNKTRKGKVPEKTERSERQPGKGDGQREAAAEGVGTCRLRSQVTQRERMTQRSR